MLKRQNSKIFEWAEVGMNFNFFAVLVIVVSVIISISLMYIYSTEEKTQDIAELTTLEQISCYEFDTKYQHGKLEEFDISNVEIRLNQCIAEVTKPSDKSFEFNYRIAKYSSSRYYEQQICVDNNGTWDGSTNLCGFKTEKEGRLANIAIGGWIKPQISQEKTQAICKFLEMECPSHVRFMGNFDTITEQTTVNYEYKKIQYKFDVTDSVIKYKIGYQMGNPHDWANIDSSHILGNNSPQIELHKNYYTWTDMVLLTIIAPSYTDNGIIDVIGDSDDFRVDVTTNGFSLDNYKIAETFDHGVFSADIVLTGFPYDADGNHLTGDKDGNDVTGEGPNGLGPYDGLLPSKNFDNLIVTIKRPNQTDIVKSAVISWDVGKIQWLESSYPSTGTGMIRVIESDMNLNPKAVDNFDVFVWSDTDLAGIEITVTETNDYTGIFEGTVFFTTDDNSSGHRLRVTSEDTIHAKYEDHTLPYPNIPTEELSIVSTARIEEEQP